MLSVASHTIGLRRKKKYRHKVPARRDADEEVHLIAEWLQSRTDKVARGERQITFKQLRKILENFGFVLENPESNMIDVCRFEEVATGFFRKKTQRVRKRYGRIGWPGDNRDLAKSEVHRVRELCGLTEAHGVDSDAFYSYELVLDTFVNRYRKVLRALSKV